MADQQEDRAGGRLLEVLEQRVGGGAFEVVDRVDDDDAARRQRRGGREQRLQRADLRDRDDAGEILVGLFGVLGEAGEFAVIGVRAGLDQRAGSGAGGRVDPFVTPGLTRGQAASRPRKKKLTPARGPG